MKFEHLVEINDFNNPLIAEISREQLWTGLVMRAEMPQLFMPYIDECHITERAELGMQRRLRYGELIVIDHVTLVHMQHVHYQVPAQNEITESSLKMSIEEPSPGSLFVRFEYDDGQNEEQDTANEMLNEYRNSAYHQADIDTVSMIRELAEAGRLDALPS
ncbi:AtaL-like protein [Undibacterium danionis]|uniref:AtaL-like protein n=1 Tax=Undibacterium danionis TaxID=1812100 RepID=A0ABV6IHM8_9BURK